MKFKKYIKLDSWSVHHQFFMDEAAFRRHLIVDINELNNDNADKEEPFKLLHQDEIVIPSVEVAYITFDYSWYSGVKATFPVFAKSHMLRSLEDWENGTVFVDITRGNLQWQIQNALSGLPLSDHCFPESLDLKEVKNERPVYNLFLGS